MLKISLEEAIELAKKNNIKLIIQDSSKKSALDKVVSALQDVNPDVEIIQADNIVMGDQQAIENNIRESADALDIINGYLEESETTEDIDDVMVKDLLNKLYRECRLNEV
jgi:ribosomal protein S7